MESPTLVEKDRSVEKMLDSSVCICSKISELVDTDKEGTSCSGDFKSQLIIRLQALLLQAASATCRHYVTTA